MDGTNVRNEASLEACDRLIEVVERALAAEASRAADPRDDRQREPLHRFALGLLRMRLRPALEAGWLDADPLHVSLFGGTNSGKSTVLNLLLGRPAAGMDVTARFSQHPEGYRLESLGDGWLARFPSRFEGYCRYEDEHPPRQADRDLSDSGYRPALALLDPNHVTAHAPEAPATTTAVLWDVPDFSTEEARFWIGAVLDTVALADVVLLTVTDESYADARGLSLFRMVSGTGVALHVVANKVGSRTLVADIRGKLDAHYAGPGRALPEERFHAFPFVEASSPGARLEALLASDEGRSLRTAIARAASEGPGRKREALAGSVAFLSERLDEVMAPLAAEADLAATWTQLVERTTRASSSIATAATTCRVSATASSIRRWSSSWTFSRCPGSAIW